jgi:hypothetical protein
MKEYRISKSIKTHNKKGTMIEEKQEMNQFRLLYMYTQKQHKETPCIAILNKHFFFFTK